MYGRSLPFLLLIRYSFSAPTPNRIPTLRVLLVRHGESENNVLPLVSRQHYENNRLADPELTAQGQLQVQQLGERFFKQVQGGRFAKIEHLRQIYVSPMVRTLQTAEAIASSVASTNVPFTIARDCFEIGGCYEGHANSLPVLGVGGLTGADIKARFPFVQDEEETKLSEGWFHHATKESLPQAVTRVRSVVDRFATTLRTSLPPPPEGKVNTVAIVCHGDFIDFFLRVALARNLDLVGKPGDDILAEGGRTTIYKSFNCQVAAIEFLSEGKCRLLYHNYFGHLIEGGEDVIDLENLGLV